jgi:NhaP-type Na+/H+ and K+/H+ antiporter
MMSAPPLLVVAILLLLSVFLSKTSSRFGVPSLLLFLGLGMLAGSDGLLGIEFDDFALAQQVGIVALAFILFSGGASTGWAGVRSVLVPGVALATVGVLLTAGVLGVLASLILGIELLEGLLLGAIIASTDAAAVFSILRSRGVALGGSLRHLLELESGSNDPAAVFLTVGIIALIQQTTEWDGARGIVRAADGLGVAIGLAFAFAATRLINRLNLEYDGLYPALTVAIVLLTYEGATWLGGSGFLATYVAGLAMANSRLPAQAKPAAVPRRAGVADADLDVRADGPAGVSLAARPRRGTGAPGGWPAHVRGAPGRGVSHVRPCAGPCERWPSCPGSACEVRRRSFWRRSRSPQEFLAPTRSSTSCSSSC